jgi:hypothetical protein
MERFFDAKNLLRLDWAPPRARRIDHAPEGIKRTLRGGRETPRIIQGVIPRARTAVRPAGSVAGRRAYGVS